MKRSKLKNIFAPCQKKVLWWFLPFCKNAPFSMPYWASEVEDKKLIFIANVFESSDLILKTCQGVACNFLQGFLINNWREGS